MSTREITLINNKIITLRIIKRLIVRITRITVIRIIRIVIINERYDITVILLLYENAPPIFLLKMRNYFLNCVVEEVLCSQPCVCGIVLPFSPIII